MELGPAHLIQMGLKHLTWLIELTLCNILHGAEVLPQLKQTFGAAEDGFVSHRVRIGWVVFVCGCKREQEWCVDKHTQMPR